MNLIRLAIKRPTAVAMFALAIVFTGIASLSRLPLNLTPDVSFPKLSVTTSWPDSSPETIEAFVTSPIEAIANTVSNIKKVDSISEEGKSTVNLEFNRGTDMDFAALELSEKLSNLYHEFPYGVQPPQIQNYVPEEFQTGRFLSYHLTGEMTLPEIREFALQRLRGPLLAVEGVADAQVYGGQDPELQVLLDREKLRTFGLSESVVRDLLQNLNIRVAAGRIYAGGRKVDLMVEDPVTEVAEIARMVLAVNRGALIRVGDVATVTLGYDEPRSLTRINGNPAVMLVIEKEVGSNTIRVADRVFARLAQLQKNFPPTLQLIKERDQSEQIRRDLRNLTSRAAFCVAVIFAVLVAFLRNWRSPLIILSTIFFSVLLTINFFYFMEIGLNLLTLAGLALGFGMMVDNSIVVLDNFYRNRSNGLPPAEAAEQGTRAVALPIIASTLTTVVAFIPFLYLTGELRIYYLPFSMAVGMALLASLLVAFTFTPSLAAALSLRAGRKSELSGTAGPAAREASRFRRGYAYLLGWTLRHRFVTIFLTLAVFAGSYYLFDRYVTKGRIWSWGSDTYIVVFINMPVGSELERTDKIVGAFEASVTGEGRVDKVFTRISPEFARMEITFPKQVQYTAFPLMLKERLTYLATQVGGPAVGVYGFGQGFYSGGGSAPRYNLQVFGYNYNEVKRIAIRIADQLKRNPRVRDVDINASSGFRRREDLYEMVLRIDRERLRRFQLSAVEVLGALQSNLRESLAWQRVRFGGKELDYRVKMADHRDFSVADLHTLTIETPLEEEVKLSDVASFEERKVLAEIVRENQQYVRGIAFEYRGPWKFGNKLVDRLIENTRLPHGYKLKRQTYFFLTQEEKTEIYWVILFALFLVYMVTAGLFESFIQPLVVMLTVPLALIGVFLIFYLTDTNFDRAAYIGVILLAGIVVNNTIILVHHVNALRAKGYGRVDAVIQGTLDRVRPILMTSATTILGLLPLIVFALPDESMWYALSLATVGGLLSSTVLVLLVMPGVMLLFTRRTH